MGNNNIFKFNQIYRMPGEGLIAEFRCGEESRLYGIDGLQYCIMERRAKGENTDEEEKALAVLNNFEG